MKKILLIVIMIVFCAIPVSAQGNDAEYVKEIDEFATDNNIDFNDIKENPFETLWDIAKKSFDKAFKQPFRMFEKVAVMLIFTSFVNFFLSPQTVRTAQLINAISVLVIFSSMYKDFMLTVQNVSDVFFQLKNFMVSFLPVFAGISFASGEMVTSTVYTGFFMMSVVAVANFCINYIIPSLNIFLSIGVTTSVSSVINLKPVCECYSKMIKTAMTVSVSVLCFVLSLQTTITQGQDTLAVKTGKMIVTSAVPIIGTTLQSAIGSVYASMGVLKGFLGIAGIAGILNIFLPQIINLAISWIGYFILSILGNIVENKAASEILSVFKEAVEIMLSMSVLFMILLLFSISIMIKIFQGV